MTAISDLGFLVVEDHEFQKWHCCNVLAQMGATRSSRAPRIIAMEAKDFVDWVRVRGQVSA